MKCIQWLLAILLCLPGCSSNGPVFIVGDELPDWALSAQSIDPASEQAPVVEGSTITFQLSPGQRRSTLKTGEDWRIGQSYLFGFDVRADPEILGSASENLVLSRFSRVTVPEDELVAVVLDRKKGATVFGRTCVAPQNLSEWHRIEIRVRIANNDTGFLEVFCDRKPIWAKEDIRTTLRADCKLSSDCDKEIAKPARFSWQMGLMAEQKVRSPVKIEMRRLHQRVIFYIPNRVGTL